MRARGEKHGRAKLTEAQVITIKTNGKSVRSTSREHRVSRKQIQRIRAGEAWRHL